MMPRILVRAMLALSLAVVAFGQEQAPSSQTTAPAPNAGSSATDEAGSAAGLPGVGTDKIFLKNGQAVVLRTTKQLSSETAKVGDPVEFEVIKPVVAGDLVVIPEHAVAIGRVVIADKKKRQLQAGKLAITVERVETVAGQSVPLRLAEVGGKEAPDPGTQIDPGAGAILAAPFILLLSHGPEWVIPRATRVVGHLDGNVILDRTSVQRAQAALPRPRTDVATIYIYRPAEGRDSPHNFSGITCGEVMLGWFHPGQFVQLQVPPGQYWLRRTIPYAGAAVNKKYLEGKAPFFPLQVERGQSYYLRVAEQKRKHWLDTITEHYLEQVDQATGADAVFAAQSWADFGLAEITPETILHLEAQPKK